MSDTSETPAPRPVTEGNAPAVADPAPESPPTSSPAEAETGSEAGVTKKARGKGAEIPHKGFVADVGVGALGCTKSICRDRSRQHSAPGVKVGGLIGANIKGYFEIGAQVGWGTLNPDVDPGTNLLSIYGVEPESLAEAAELLGLQVADLEIDDARSNLLRIGPTLRVHYPPKGRVNGFLGAGFGYTRFRTNYDTGIGKMGITFHGLDVPFQGGLIVYLGKHVALTGQFIFQWTYHLTLNADQPGQSVTAPVSLFENGLDANQLRRDLPHFWTFDFGLRVRI